MIQIGLPEVMLIIGVGACLTIIGMCIRNHIVLSRWLREDEKRLSQQENPK